MGVKRAAPIGTNGRHLAATSTVKLGGRLWRGAVTRPGKTSPRQRARMARFAAWLLASVLAHVAVFMVLVAMNGHEPGFMPGPVTTLTFYRLGAAGRRPIPPRPLAPPPGQRRFTPLAATGPGPRLAAPVAGAGAGAGPALPAGLGAALRRSLGCANPVMYQLTAEERRACDDRGDEAQRLVWPPVSTAKTRKWDKDVRDYNAKPTTMMLPCGDNPNLGLGCENPDAKMHMKF